MFVKLKYREREREREREKKGPSVEKQTKNKKTARNWSFCVCNEILAGDGNWWITSSEHSPTQVQSPLTLSIFFSLQLDSSNDANVLQPSISTVHPSQTSAVESHLKITWLTPSMLPKLWKELLGKSTGRIHLNHFHLQQFYQSPRSVSLTEKNKIWNKNDCQHSKTDMWFSVLSYFSSFFTTERLFKCCFVAW